MRTRTRPLACLAIAAISLGGQPRRAEAASQELLTKARVYVGTYSGTGSEGIYRFDLDLVTGKPTGLTVAAKATSPSFLALDAANKHLYAVSEVDSVGGRRGGGVISFAVASDGSLSPINSQSSVGAGPCHLTVDKTGRCVLVANYGGGSTTVLPIDETGRLGPASAFVQHTGSSVNPQRQKEPHAHSVNLDPSNQFAYVADLGLDQMVVYRLDPKDRRIVPNDPPSAALDPGAGPRHFTFHPGGKFAYTINELDSTVTAWSFDPATGALKKIEAVSTLPTGFKGTNYPADIHVDPSGKFLYGSNRGHDSIAVFAIDAATGKLTPVSHQGKGIKNPRNFGIDPTGAFALVANQDANTILVFKVDRKTGALEPTEHVVKVAKPVCVVFVPLPGK